jgi:hypothetical protein
MFRLDMLYPEIYNNTYTNTQGGVMFSPIFYLESFQNTKKIVTDQIFKDPALNKAAHAYIDAQTQFAKMAVNNTIEMAKYSVDSVSKVLFPQKEQASKAPYKVEKEAN